MKATILSPAVSLHEIDHLDGHMYTEIAEKMLTPEELEELTRQEEQEDGE